MREPIAFRETEGAVGSPLLTLKEACSFLKISPSTLYRYCSRGLIPHIRKSFGLRFCTEDLEEWILHGKREAKLAEEILKNALTKPSSIAIDKTKGGNSKLAKKGQTCFNYGYGYVRLRTYKSGSTCWTIDYRDENGKRIQKSLPHVESREEAAYALQKMAVGVYGRRNGIENRKEKIGFSDFAKIYLEDYMMTVRRNFRPEIYRLRKLCDYFGDVDLRAVSPLMIERFRKSKLEEGRTKSTCNRYLQLMKRMFNIAIDEGYAEDNPVRKVKLYSEKDNLQERVLTETEETRLMEASSETLKPILVAALNTGMRKSEILNLEWTQVDLEARRIRVEKTKSGKIRFIPVNDVLFNVLNKLKNRSGKSSFVFFNPETGKPFLDMKTAFKGACKRAGISNLRFHDLRHTFASRLVEKGVDIETLKELLGHHSITITQRYIHSSDERKRAAVELLSRKVEEQICDVSVTQGNQSKLIH